MSNSRYIIGIGAQKSGTTWLASYFSAHPQILMSPIKELHFFDSIYTPQLCARLEADKINSFVHIAHHLQLEDIVEKNARYSRFDKLMDGIKIGNDINNYRNYFARHAKDELAYCEITPAYSLLDTKGFAAIKSLADDVRLIFLMRNPVDRFWSGLRMQAQKKPQVLEKVEKFLNKSRFALRTDYNKTLTNVYEVFPKERVFVGFYEHLFNTQTITQLCQFCDIDFIVPDTQKKVLEGVSIPLTPQMRQTIYYKFSHIYDWAEREFGENLPASWQADINAYRL
ncbi:MAG: sulfotransferase [Methylococcaceae bacterium]